MLRAGRGVNGALHSENRGGPLADELLERLRRLLAPRYEVDRRIGAGGMGLVYAGRHVLLDLRVAIKVLRPDLASARAVERFLREPRVLAKLVHPNIVHVYDTSPESAELSYYVMEYLEGEPLDARLERGPLPPKQAARLGREILEALGHAHRRRVIHRDVKPGNIFLVDGRAVLTDWGIAKVYDDPALTGVGHLPGTLAYMAPELLAGAEATPQSDLYALGMVLFQAATGRPWEVGMPLEAVDQAGLPRWYAQAVRRALRWAPDERWRDAAELASALVPRVPAPPPPVLVAGALALLGTPIYLLRCGLFGWCGVAPPAPLVRIEVQGDAPDTGTLACAVAGELDRYLDVRAGCPGERRGAGPPSMVLQGALARRGDSV
ncbi:MAG TPA: serine/threonine-protein kinase, partial [Gemmatimonadales bacterium]|nr:serine/threonine-protein kinase [Gemmatimonadales bacterium]